jgi:hypothetical protein
VSAAIYVLLNRWHGNYGWLTLFNFTFFKSSPYPAQMVLSHRFSDYVVPYVSTLRDLWIEPIAQVSVYALCAYVCFVCRRELAAMANRHLFFTLPVTFIVLRLALFPSYEGRFFAFPATMILVGTLGAMQAAMQSQARNRTTSG